MDKIITITIINSKYFWDGFFDVFFPAIIFGIPIALAILIPLKIKNTRKANRERRKQMLSKNHCIIGCKNCNAQQCPNNPNYIRKLL